jgi:hypothetical protein
MLRGGREADLLHVRPGATEITMACGTTIVNRRAMRREQNRKAKQQRRPDIPLADCNDPHQLLITAMHCERVADLEMSRATRTWMRRQAARMRAKAKRIAKVKRGA